MGKHFENTRNNPKRLENSKNPKVKNKNSIGHKKSTIKIIGFIVAIFLVICCIYKINFIKNTSKNTKEIRVQATSKEGEVLVLKSIYEKNKIIKYTFLDNKTSNVEVYQQFEDKEQFLKKRDNYKNRQDINLITIDEENMIIIYNKKEFGTDTDLSYYEIYDKYMKIVGAYEKI